VNYLISYHNTLVLVFVGVLVLNIALPYIYRANAVKFIKYTRIGYFVFWALWAMVLFGGLVVFMFQKQALPLHVIAMIVATIAIAVIDGYRAIKQGRIWRGSKGEDLAFGFSSKMVVVELLIVIVVSIYAYLV